MRARLAILAGSVALGGCAYGYGGYGSGFSLGVGYGSGYGGYYDPYCGYGGGSYGLGYGGYGGYDYYGFPYGGTGYGSCGYGFGSPYFGWYDNYYYPGSGYYVYDRYRRPHVWSDTQKRYWTDRRNRALSSGKVKEQALRENWSGFDRSSRPTLDRSTRRSGQQERIRPQSQERQVVRETVRTTRSPDRDSRIERRRDRKSDDTRPQ